MSEPSSTYSRLTCLPCGPVCTVTRVAPSICLTNSLTSATDLAMRTPPLSPAEASLNLPLPRPPAWIWLFTTQIGPPSVFAATSESEARSTGTPLEIGTPNSCSSALAWYSWIFLGRPPKALKDRCDWMRSAAEQIRRDLLAGINQTLHRADRLVECFAVLAGQFDLDNTLDPLGADHDRH